MDTVTVPTVRGEINASELGQTLMHEHIFVLSREILDNIPGMWDEERYVEDAVRQLNELADVGISSIADPTVIGLGRYIPRIERVAQKTRINIVVATGVYAFAEMPHFFRYRGPGTTFGGPEPITELLLRDIREGIGGTSVKAGFLKVALQDMDMTPDVERITACTAEVHLETGTPILTHTGGHNRSGLVQQRFLAERGVDLGRVVVGHVGDTTDVDYLMQLADAGSFLGMDRFGYAPFLDTPSRVDTIRRLCQMGYADRIVLGHDTAVFTDLLPAKERAVHMPDLSYQHIPRDVLPMLRVAGVTDADITTMLVDNPRRFFSGG